MAVNIGKISLDASPNELKRFGIYCVEDIDGRIEFNAPLDFDFLLINGERKNTFTDAIKSVIDHELPSLSLFQSIEKKNGMQKNKERIEEVVFKWLSTIIEKFPGRIIILGGTEPKEWENVRKNFFFNSSTTDKTLSISMWILRRVVWLKDLEGFEIFNRNNDIHPVYSISNTSKIDPRDLSLCLYYNWIKNIQPVDILSKIEVEVNLVKPHSGTELMVKKADVMTNIVEIKNALLEKKVLSDAKEESIYQRLINMFGDSDGIKLNDIPKKLIGGLPSGPKSDEIKGFFNRLESKASNKIPACFSSENAGSALNFSLYTSTSTESMKSAKKLIKYCRHDMLSPGNMDYLYQEYLSGNLIHFSILYNVFNGSNHAKKAELFFNLVENGLVNIIVADERIAQYVHKNPGVMLKYDCGHITILKGIHGLIETPGGESVADFCDDLSLRGFSDIKEAAEKRKYDIFIIHQGILDKTKLPIESIEKEINRWKKQYFSFVVVTSGRGSPANIPKNSRFIPFSILESTLLTSDISKFTLVKVIFKSLSRSN